MELKGTLGGITTAAIIEGAGCRAGIGARSGDCDWPSLSVGRFCGEVVESHCLGLADVLSHNTATGTPAKPFCPIVTD